MDINDIVKGITNPRDVSLLLSLNTVNENVIKLNKNMDEFIRIMKLPMFARIKTTPDERLLSGSISVPANSEVVANQFTDSNNLIVLGAMTISILGDTTGTNGASYIGFKEFINGQTIDYGTIYDAITKGKTSPRNGIYVQYYNTTYGYYIYVLSNQGGVESRIARGPYKIILYNNDDTAHTIAWAFTPTMLTGSEYIAKE